MTGGPPVQPPAKDGQLRRGPRTGGLAGLADVLLVQCGRDDLDLVDASRPGTGVVVCGAASLDGAREVLGTEFAGPVLADRRRYSGRRRLPATEPISARWIDQQRDAGLTVALTDSGYVAQGDLHGVVNILTTTAGLGPDVVAVLPVHAAWLQADLPRLIGEINAHGAAIALIVEHRADPFSVAATVHGLVRLLRTVTVPVVQLCTDVSGIGAIAFGATAAAVGVRSSLRHLYPSTGGGHNRGVEAVLFEPGLAFVHVDKLARGVAAMPSDPMWQCQCGTCLGRRMDWLLFASQYEQRCHSIELLTDWRDHLVQGGPPGPDRQQSWRAACRSAEFQFSSVAVSRVGWELPRALRHWQRA